MKFCNIIVLISYEITIYLLNVRCTGAIKRFMATIFFFVNKHNTKFHQLLVVFIYCTIQYRVRAKIKVSDFKARISAIDARSFSESINKSIKVYKTHLRTLDAIFSTCCNDFLFLLYLYNVDCRFISQVLIDSERNTGSIRRKEGATLFPETFSRFSFGLVCTPNHRHHPECPVAFF